MKKSEIRSETNILEIRKRLRMKNKHKNKPYVLFQKEKRLRLCYAANLFDKFLRQLAFSAENDLLFSESCDIVE